MYRLTGLTLYNCCQHAQLSVALNPGLTAITGRNGSGKTSILRGLAYALTGLVDGLWGTQKDLQKDGTSVAGYAEASFTDGASAYTIRRYTVSSTKFPDIVTKNGETVAIRRKEVDAYMENVFGMSCALMFQVCWGRQGDLPALLTATPSMIGTFLSQVFDTKMMDKLRDKLKLQLDTIATIPATCEEQLVRDKADYESLPGTAQMKDELEALTAQNSEINERMNDLNKIIISGCTQDEKDNEVARCRKLLKDAEDRIAQMQKPSIAKDVVLASGITAETVNQIERTLHELSETLNETAILLAADKDKRNMESLRINSTEYSYRDMLSRISGAGHTCILCGSAMDMEAADYKDKAIRALTAYKTYEEYVNGMDSQLMRDKEGLERIDARIASRQADIDRISAERDTLTASLEVARTAADAYMWYEAEDALNRASSELKTAEGMIVSDSESTAEYDRLMHQLKDNLKRINDLHASIASVNAKRALLETMIKDETAMCEKRDICRAAREALTTIRDAFSQSRAQARYLQTKIQRLNAELSHYVRLTGMPFTLRLDPDTRCFVYCTQDGYDHPAAHLSGAQKAMSAIALQMALLSVMQPSMNLYLIDEPTEALDPENTVIMSSMFEHMNTMLSSMDGVMMIVARDDQVLDACGDVIMLND